MTKEVTLKHGFQLVSIKPGRPLAHRLQYNDIGRVQDFSFLGSLSRKRIYQSRGFETYFEELDYVKNFGFWDQIPKSYQFYIKECMLFLYRRKTLFLQKSGKNLLKGTFRYVLKSDVLKKSVLVEHQFEPFRPDLVDLCKAFDLWVHNCSVKEGIISDAVPVPFVFSLYLEGIRHENLESMLHKHLSKASRKCSPAFRDELVGMKTIKVGASGT